jgi:long-chain fatty acid transport protein
MTYGGSTTYNPLPGTTPAASTSTTASFQFPQIISGGVSFRPTPKWNVEADVDWSDWHTLRTVPLLGTGSNPYFAGMGNLELALNWHGSWLAELGATRYLRNGWFVSSGYFYSSETTSQQYFNPAIPDTELHVASLGGGHKGKHLDWAAAVQLIGGPKRTISNTQTPSQFPANGSYQLFVPTFSASANYHF